MWQRLRKKIKKVLITLRFTILSAFITLFIIANLVVIYTNYAGFSKAMLFIATILMDKTSQLINEDFTNKIKIVERDNINAAGLFSEGVLSTNVDELIYYTVNLAKQNDFIEQTYWGDERGVTINAINEVDNTIVTEVILPDNHPPLQYFLYRDKNENVIKKVIAPKIDYDPRTRPWYIQAKKAGKTIWTGMYRFQERPYLGITVATPVYEKNGKFKGVYATDIRLDWLAKFLNQQKITKNAIIFIATDKGQLVAFPGQANADVTVLQNVYSPKIPWLSKSFEIYKKTQKPNFDFVYNNREFIANYQVIPQLVGSSWIIGMVIPVEDFTAELKKINTTTIIIGLIVLLFGIVLVSYLVTLIVNPIKKLVRQTQKIKNFELEDQEEIHSRIKEVFLLDEGLNSMRVGLRAFQKYVPASLVRQLIETGENARIGGSKKQLTIFFSDIKNFTTLAESMDPNLLMEYVCNYFEILSKVIIDEQGTIDKYIGDSIMAFWGAPISVLEPEVHAARAALKCLEQLELFNREWRKKDTNILVTRIGLHVGQAIVGNIGSSDRMNYTAIGDVINVASRMEGLNKVYGTGIIVTEELYKKIKTKFVFRLVDLVMVKGKTTGGYVYELLTEHKPSLSFDFDEYERTFLIAFGEYQNGQWKEAIKHFNECLKIYPEDTLAPIFIQRCEDFIANPPANWDGVWH